MESFETQAVILAPSSIVRDILTDQGNYPVWNFGIAEIQGDIVPSTSARRHQSDRHRPGLQAH